MGADSTQDHKLYLKPKMELVGNKSYKLEQVQAESQLENPQYLYYFLYQVL